MLMNKLINNYIIKIYCYVSKKLGFFFLVIFFINLSTSSNIHFSTLTGYFNNVSLNNQLPSSIEYVSAKDRWLISKSKCKQLGN